MQNIVKERRKRKRKSLRIGLLVYVIYKLNLKIQHLLNNGLEEEDLVMPTIWIKNQRKKK